jgi:hypothetical protein
LTKLDENHQISKRENSFLPEGLLFLSYHIVKICNRSIANRQNCITFAVDLKNTFGV